VAPVIPSWPVSVALVPLAILAAAGTSGCSSGRCDLEQAQHMTAKTIEQVQNEHTDAWMAIPGVVGTAIGQSGGATCILVLTAANTDEVRHKIPPMVEGYPVVVQYVGEIRALDK
jgi:hypothetical protein